MVVARQNYSHKTEHQPAWVDRKCDEEWSLNSSDNSILVYIIVVGQIMAGVACPSLPVSKSTSRSSHQLQPWPCSTNNNIKQSQRTTCVEQAYLEVIDFTREQERQCWSKPLL